MNDRNDQKKLQKYKDRVYNFLDANRHDDENKDRPTHVAFGNFMGKFSLDKDKQKEFMRLYINAVENGVLDMSILETQNEYGPLIIDIDLEIPIEDYKNTRLYDTDLVKKIIEKYILAINYYLLVTPDKYKICVFEKKKPQEKDTTIKDGIHIILPELCVQSKIRHLIRYRAVKLCIDDDIFSEFTQPPEKIIDKAVVSTNGWFMYGSKKQAGYLYELTTMYDNKLNTIYDHTKGILYDHINSTQTFEKYDNKTLIKYLSLRSKNYTANKMTELNDINSDSDIEVECNEHGINTHIKSEQIKYISGNKEDEMRKASKFVSMLSSKRADDYHDWIRVGLVLHNIETSLLSTWIEFSKRCTAKFKEGECEKAWRVMKNPTSRNLLTIRSLSYWAKQDDPKQYDSYIKEEFRNIMNKSLNGDTYSLAKSIYAKYSDKFVCSSIKSNIWL
jgi:hypothetical protein